YPMHPFPPGVTDPRELWELNVGVMNALFAEPVSGFRTSVGLAAVDNVRDHVFTQRPWLATDAVLRPWVQPAELAVVQTGAWVLADERPLPAELSALLDAGQATGYV
ncbi:glycosyl transferase, partial [Streptomyces rubellomurinus subsp. indigoferus]